MLKLPANIFTFLLSLFLYSCSERVVEEDTYSKLKEEFLLINFNKINDKLDEISEKLSGSYKGRIINHIELSNGEKLDISQYPKIDEYSYNQYRSRYDNSKNLIHEINEALKTLEKFHSLTSKNIIDVNNPIKLKLLQLTPNFIKTKYETFRIWEESSKIYKELENSVYLIKRLYCMDKDGYVDINLFAKLIKLGILDIKNPDILEYSLKSSLKRYKEDAVRECKYYLVKINYGREINLDFWNKSDKISNFLPHYISYDCR